MVISDICSCGNLPPIQNGVLIPSSGPYNCGAIVTIVCDSGYVPQGQISLQCLSSEFWSAAVPVCLQGERLP